MDSAIADRKVIEERAMEKDKETRRLGDKEKKLRILSPCLLVSMSPHLASRRQLLRKSGCFVAALLCTAVLTGCGKVDPPPFRLNMTYVVSKQIVPDHQKAIADILDAMFGTPNEPFAMAET